MRILTRRFFASCLAGLRLPLGGLLLGLAACQPGQGSNDAAASGPPPVGHYEGRIKAAGQGEARAALDIRHPSPGHYEAELTVPGAPALSFVGDTIFFGQSQLRLLRPGQAGQILTLTLEGDFWRGTLQLDSLRAETLLVKRGPPTPSTYRVEELPQDKGSAWLYGPADTGTPGPALVLLPDAATAGTAALWGDALAREGIIVLVLPAADSATTGLGPALGLLRTTPGADSATIGAWAAGPRAAALAREMAAPGGPRLAFMLAQQAAVGPADRAGFQELSRRRLPVLGLYGGPAARPQSARLRAALGGRRSTVRTYPGADNALRVPGALGPGLAPAAVSEVVEWLRSR